MESYMTLSEKIIKRLNQRKNLYNVALSVSSVEKRDTVCVQEKDTGTYCTVSTQQGGDTNVFVCNNSYGCDKVPPSGVFVCTNYDCSDTQRNYTSCGGTGSFQCNQTDSPSFSCEQGGSAADYFDCQTFDCGHNGNDGISETFDCNTVVDFLCPGHDYDCVDDFDCTAGHGFFCTNHHDCEDQFTCSGGTVQGCPAVGGGTTAVSCVPGPNVNGYSGMSGGDGNDNPGDFICAHPGGTDDTFDCGKNFQCEAQSDFSCLDTGEFRCAQQSGSGSDTFRCGSTTVFECFERFECASADYFNCNRPAGAAYGCKSSYALCQNKTEKGCQKDYNCKSNHGCPNDAPSANHDCVTPTFNCLGTTYNCSKSVPPYSNTGG